MLACCGDNAASVGGLLMTAVACVPTLCGCVLMLDGGCGGGIFVIEDEAIGTL